MSLRSLRARLFAAIAVVALLSLALALAIGALLTRRAVERNTVQDVSAQLDLLAEREREAVQPFSRLRSFQEFLDRQDQRIVAVPLDGSSPLLPPDRAARLRRGAQLEGTVARTEPDTSTQPDWSAARDSCCCSPRARRPPPGVRSCRA